MRDIYLPDGNRWYQFNNFVKPLSSAIDGGTTLPDFDASISDDTGHIPYIVSIYVKEGENPIAKISYKGGEKM